MLGKNSEFENVKMKLGKPEDISFPLIFIDGLARCGKSSLSKIIPSMNNMEHINFLGIMESLLPALTLGHVTEDFVKAHLSIFFNELTYNLQLSRNVNFRPKDQTGIHNFTDPKIYYDRLKLDEGVEIIETCRSKVNYIPFQTHDFMVNLKQLNNLNLNYKMLSLWRNPIDNIYSWVTRGWGSRFRNADPGNFTLSIQMESNSLLPWYCANEELPDKSFNDAEFCVYVAMNLIKRAIKNALTAKKCKKIKFIFFEKLCTDPIEEIIKISQFLNVDWGNGTKNTITEANFPRTLNEESYEKKIEFFQKSLNKSLFETLIELTNNYQSQKYNLN